MASFAQLTVLILAGIAGPLLSAPRRVVIPVVVGELLAGIALGKTGAGIIKADDSTIAFLGNIGFAMLMMVAGMHVPLRNKALLGSLRKGLIAVLAGGVLAAAGGLAIAHGLGIGHPAIWAILLATGSAAIVLPAVQEAGLGQEMALLAMAWATIADVATIVPVPLVMNPSKAVRAGLGALAVAVGAVIVWLIARWLAKQTWVHDLRGESSPKAWALDLRVSLVALFALCALAEWIGTSIMIAGFAAGLIVAAEGGPQRLSDQVSGVATGFLVPVFFVVLGASLNVRELVKSATSLELAAALIVGLTAVHVLSGKLIKAPVATGLIVSAQLGVPAAVVKLGLSSHVLKAGEGAAVIVAALASLAICGAGVTLAKRGADPSADPRADPVPVGAT
ncbi:MAG: cation:proton antiporter [Solirubrobacteraceae bacterium]